MANFLNNILFIFQRLNWLSVLDILLVTLIFFVLLYSLRDTQAMVLLRGMIFLIVALVLLTTLVELPAFSWVRGYEEGSLTPMQLESLQAMVDNGEADSLLEAARLLDYQSTHWAGDEPGPQAY